MNLKMDQIKSAASTGDPNSISKLASMHIYGMFPGVNPQEGNKLLEILVNHHTSDTPKCLSLGYTM